MNILPSGVQTLLYELREATEPTYSAERGGQYIKSPPERVAFWGALLPLSADDLRRAPQGTYTANSRKLYTQHTLTPGAQVAHGDDTYTVTGDVNYGSINSLKRYTLERKGVAK